ncbi:MAG: T9SS type A sorting domain-containing protein [Haliscomenobacter sp.]|nr:T9SS type A sorting domain-containing protein [Haliscomenobacter sp.]
MGAGTTSVTLQWNRNAPKPAQPISALVKSGKVRRYWMYEVQVLMRQSRSVPGLSAGTYTWVVRAEKSGCTGPSATNGIAESAPFSFTITTGSISSSCTGTPQPFGTLLGSFNGIEVYSNGNPDFVSNQYNNTGGINGIKWQCVEFARRYMYQIHGQLLPIVDGAENFITAALPAGLQRYLTNANYEFPVGTPIKVGDAVVSDVGRDGHIAIVREIGNDYIKVAQQNFTNEFCDENYTCTKINLTNGSFKLKFNDKYQIKAIISASAVVDNSKIEVVNGPTVLPSSILTRNKLGDMKVTFKNNGTSAWVGCVFLSFRDKAGNWQDALVQNVGLNPGQSQEIARGLSNITTPPGDYLLVPRIQKNCTGIPVELNPTTTFTIREESAKLTVNIKPIEAVQAGARWKIYNDWMNSGQTISEIAPGQYSIQFQEAPGWKKPESQLVSLNPGSNIPLNVEYSKLNCGINPKTAYVSDIKIDGFTVTWENVNAIHYEVGITETTDITYRDEKKYKTSQSKYVFKGLQIGKTYMCRIRSMCGNGEWSNWTGKLIEVSLANSSSNTGDLTIEILPAQAVQEGAQWKFQGEQSWRNSNSPIKGISQGDYTIEFKQIPHWKAPQSALIKVESNTSNSKEFSYQEIAYVDITPSILPYFSYEGGSKKMSIESNTAWSIRKSDAWIKISETSGGHNSQEITLSVDPNPDPLKKRTGAIEFISSGNKLNEMVVNQMSNTRIPSVGNPSHKPIGLEPITKRNLIVSFDPSKEPIFDPVKKEWTFHIKVENILNLDFEIYVSDNLGNELEKIGEIKAYEIDYSRGVRNIPSYLRFKRPKIDQSFSVNSSFEKKNHLVVRPGNTSYLQIFLWPLVEEAIDQGIGDFLLSQKGISLLEELSIEEEILEETLYPLVGQWLEDLLAKTLSSTSAELWQTAAKEVLLNAVIKTTIVETVKEAIALPASNANYDLSGVVEALIKSIIDNAIKKIPERLAREAVTSQILIFGDLAFKLSDLSLKVIDYTDFRHYKALLPIYFTDNPPSVIDFLPEDGSNILYDKTLLQVKMTDPEGDKLACDFIITPPNSKNPIRQKTTMNEKGYWYYPIAGLVNGKYAWHVEYYYSGGYPLTSSTGIRNKWESQEFEFNVYKETQNVHFQEPQLQILDSQDGPIISKIYPNPVSDLLHVELNDSNKEIVNYYVYDSQGRLVLNSHLDDAASVSFSISLQGFGSGTYIIKINAGTKWETKAFEIIK